MPEQAPHSWTGLDSPDAVSDCIGAIYDCAIDPGLWPTALERIGELVRGVCGVVVLAEPQAGITRFHRSWNLGDESARLFYLEHAAENPLTPLFARFAVDEPYNIPAVLDPAAWEASRLYREFGEPHGFRDCVGVTVLKTPMRFASLWMATPTENDYSTTRELRIMGLLAPHVRRSLAIGDLIETHAHDIGQILRETLQAERYGLNLYMELLKIVEGNSISLEEYARGLIAQEEAHIDEIDKMLRKPGETAISKEARDLD